MQPSSLLLLQPDSPTPQELLPACSPATPGPRTRNAGKHRGLTEETKPVAKMWGVFCDLRQAVAPPMMHSSCRRNTRETALTGLRVQELSKRRQRATVPLPWNKTTVILHAGSGAGCCPAGMWSSWPQPPITGAKDERIFVQAHELLF